jgi:hypothetical protein
MGTLDLLPGTAGLSLWLLGRGQTDRGNGD